jgi:hypothetical protein
MPAIITTILGLLAGPLDKLIPDPNARNEFQLKLLLALQSADLSQMKVNEAEAAHRSIFVAGWRPFIGWICGAALVYQFLFYPLAVYVASFVSDEAVTRLLNAPKLDNNLWELLFAMLGLGAMRSFEKVKGVAAK